jgi:hypothetical protein
VACGEYIVFLDSDDWIDRDALSVFYEVLKSRDLNLLSFSYKNINCDGTFRDKAPLICPTGIILNMDIFLNYRRLGPMAWCQIYKNYFLKINNLKFIDGILCEDVDFLLRVSCLADRILFLEYYGYNYFLRENSIMRCKDLEHLKQRTIDLIFIFKNLDDLKKMYKENPVKLRNIQERINEIAFPLFIDLISGTFPFVWANERLREMKGTGILPLPVWRDDFCYRLFRLLTLLNIPFIVMYLVYKIITGTSNFRMKIKKMSNGLNLCRD